MKMILVIRPRDRSRDPKTLSRKNAEFFPEPGLFPGGIILPAPQIQAGISAVRRPLIGDL